MKSLIDTKYFKYILEKTKTMQQIEKLFKNMSNYKIPKHLLAPIVSQMKYSYPFYNNTMDNIRENTIIYINSNTPLDNIKSNILEIISPLIFFNRVENGNNVTYVDLKMHCKYVYESVRSETPKSVTINPKLLYVYGENATIHKMLMDKKNYEKMINNNSFLKFFTEIFILLFTYSLNQKIKFSNDSLDINNMTMYKYFIGRYFLDNHLNVKSNEISHEIAAECAAMRDRERLKILKDDFYNENEELTFNSVEIFIKTLQDTFKRAENLTFFNIIERFNVTFGLKGVFAIENFHYFIFMLMSSVRKIGFFNDLIIEKILTRNLLMRVESELNKAIN